MGRKLVRTVKDHVATSPDELTCSTDEVLAVEDATSKPGWLKCFKVTQPDAKGFVEFSFLEHLCVIEDDVIRAGRGRKLAVALYDYTAGGDGELSTRPGDVFFVTNDKSEEWLLVQNVVNIAKAGAVPRPLVCVFEGLKAAPLASPKFETNRLVGGARKGSTPDVADKGKEEGGEEAKTPRSAPWSKRTNEEMALSLAANAAKAVDAKDSIESARVLRWEKRKKDYYFVLEIKCESVTKTIYRKYEDFFDLQVKLLEQFPDEAGKTGRARVIPYIPGPKMIVTSNVTTKRRVELHEYMQILMSLPLSKSRLVTEFLSETPEDMLLNSQLAAENGFQESESGSPSRAFIEPPSNPAPWSKKDSAELNRNITSIVSDERRPSGLVSIGTPTLITSSALLAETQDVVASSGQNVNTTTPEPTRFATKSTTPVSCPQPRPNTAQRPIPSEAEAPTKPPRTTVAPNPSSSNNAAKIDNGAPVKPTRASANDGAANASAPPKPARSAANPAAIANDSVAKVGESAPAKPARVADKPVSAAAASNPVKPAPTPGAAMNIPKTTSEAPKTVPAAQSQVTKSAQAAPKPVQAATHPTATTKAPVQPVASPKPNAAQSASPKPTTAQGVSPQSNAAQSASPKPTTAQGASPNPTEVKGSATVAPQKAAVPKPVASQPTQPTAAKALAPAPAAAGAQGSQNSLNAQTNATSSSNPTAASQAKAVKVKVVHGEDTIALMAPLTIDFQELRQKICSKLKGEFKELYYKDAEGDLVVFDEDAMCVAMEECLEKGVKLEIQAK
ncbi:bud emergence protein 1 [Quaeritorhiza haematococci]|nr:bud emergence protein 1 [Quaeritorhiza haematococci]